MILKKSPILRHCRMGEYLRGGYLLYLLSLSVTTYLSCFFYIILLSMFIMFYIKWYSKWYTKPVTNKKETAEKSTVKINLLFSASLPP